MLKKTSKYRLYPTKRQQHLLEQTLEECRWVYNQTLAHRKDAWEQKQQSVSLFDTNHLLTQWKSERQSLYQVYSQVLQNVQVRVDLAFKAFFRRVKAKENPGFPRFKGRGWYDSFTFSQTGFALFDDKLKLSKIGLLKIKLHRPINGKIKTLTIRRTSTGKWFACFSCVDVPNQVLQPSNSVVGIDLGLITFAMLSDGKKIDNPRFFQSEQKLLKRAQQQLSKAKKGSPKHKKHKKVVARVHERISNKRSNFAHQLSHKLINKYGTIVFENLNIKRMLQNGNKGLSKSISDAAWNQLVSYTTYKAESAGRQVILIDPRNTSQMCSRCGQIVKKKLSDRVHKCPSCNLKMDRDLNAAINILRLGLQSPAVKLRSLRIRS